MIHNIAVIGAGNISKRHLDAYRQIPGITVSAICDLNNELAQLRAQEYGIPNVYTDYHNVLNAPDIDAVSIVTPTFTHAQIVREALTAGKHVLCEKPPALTYDEAVESERLAVQAGKVLMYGFVVRFQQENQLLKQLITEGRLGELYYAEATRTENCSGIGGWFRDKTKSGGGCLMDAAIHQLDLMLWLMDYSKVISVKGFTSDVNKDLPERIKGLQSGWEAADNAVIPRTIESFATGFITLEGGKNIIIKAAHISNTPNPGTRFELLGDRGGVYSDKDGLKMLTIDPSNYFVKTQPVINNRLDHFQAEIQHFVDCCNGQTRCIPNAHEGTQLMRVMNAIYASAENGEEIRF